MFWLLACAGEGSLPDPCAVAAVDAPGPLLAERRAVADPAARARVYVREARQTGDVGFYALADQALQCALARAPEEEELVVLRAHVRLQGHHFAEVEATLRPRLGPEASWLAWATYGDALMEQGRLDEAADAYQEAVDRRPGLLMYDRIGWLRWLWGDLDGALEMQRLAARAATPRDPDGYAWVYARLGWLRALRGEPAPELDLALQVQPGHRPARFARGRLRLSRGEAGAAEDLRHLADTVEGARALHELDAGVDVAAVRAEDPRGWAMWLIERDPAQARALLEEELRQRQDGLTRAALLRARAALGEDVGAAYRALLAEGSIEPRVLLWGGELLGDPALLQRALDMGPGLLPSEQASARAALARLGATPS